MVRRVILNKLASVDSLCSPPVACRPPNRSVLARLALSDHPSLVNCLPFNIQGAYTHVQPRLQRCLEEEREVVPMRITYAGRRASASPSTGFAGTFSPMSFGTKSHIPRGMILALADSGRS